MTRTLCNYFTDRTATIRICDYLGQTFGLYSGVPQGGTQTLSNLYTHDLTGPYEDTGFIAFVDDIIQIIPNRSKSASRRSLQTAGAIKTVDDYECKWQIRINMDKFKVFSIGRTKIVDIRLDNRTI